MRRLSVLVLLVLALGAPSAYAADIGIGAFGGVSIPVANELSEQGSQFGIRVPVNLLPLLTIEPFFASAGLGEIEETFGGTTYTRDGGDLTAFGVQALITFGTPVVKIFPIVGLGSYKLERSGADEISEMGVNFGLGLGFSPIPKLTASVRGDLAAIITDETSLKYANVTVGASYSLISVP